VRPTNATPPRKQAALPRHARRNGPGQRSGERPRRAADHAPSPAEHDLGDAPGEQSTAIHMSAGPANAQ